MQIYNEYGNLYLGGWNLIWLVLKTLFILIFPYLFGRLIITIVKRDYHNLLSCYMLGLISSWSVFQLLCVPMTLLKLPFHVLAWIYLSIMAGILVCYFVFAAKQERDFIKTTIKSIPVERSFFVAAGILGILILVQTLVPVLTFTYIQADDASCIVQAIDNIRTDSLYQLNPYTGEVYETLIMKRVLTSHSAYISFISWLLNVSPTIIAHTFYPLWLTPLAYVVYYLLGKELFRNGKSAVLFLIILSLINIFGAYSHYSSSFQLLVLIYQGKAMLQVIVLPFVLWLIFQFTKESTGKYELVLLLDCVIASCGLTMMGAGMTPLLMCVAGGIQIVWNKLYKLIPYIMISCIPAMIYALVYVFGG